MKRLIVIAAGIGVAMALSATPSNATHNQLGLKYCVIGTWTAPAPAKLYPADPCWKAPAPGAPKKH